MFTNQLEAISNRADWIRPISFTDTETDDLIDLSTATIEFFICDQGRDQTARVTASTTNGKITLPDTTVMELHLTKDDLSCLCAGTYDIFGRVTIGGETEEVLAGTLAILDGGPSS